MCLNLPSRRQGRPDVSMNTQAVSAIVAVPTCGWLGFVCGPPLGELASATSLSLALGVVPALVACIAVATELTPHVRVPADGDDQAEPAMSRAAR
jgi:hypothetical protein